MILLILEHIQTAPKDTQICMLDLSQRIVYNFLTSWQILYQEPVTKLVHLLSSFMEPCNCLPFDGVINRKRNSAVNLW